MRAPLRALSAAALSLQTPTLLPQHCRVVHRRCCSIRAAHAASVVQEIYERAAQGDLDGAAAAMDLLTADDVGLVAGGTGSKPGSPIGYHHVHADDGLSMGIFVIPAGGEIPLHDHPGMSVLSKLLFGSLRVTAYDMPDAPPPARSLFGRLGGKERTLACAGPPSVRTVSAPCETLRLDPVAGNIHSFRALEHTAIFDVLTPPYNDFDGRSCHYYEEAGPASGDGVVSLREVPWPSSLRVVNRPFGGPAVRF